MLLSILTFMAFYVIVRHNVVHYFYPKIKVISMLSSTSIWAIVLRHLRLWRRDINILLFILYWPLLDIITWGYLGTWIGQFVQFQNYETIALLGILLWQVVGRGCNIICSALCEELWSNNLINLFATPLKTIEWITSVIVYYAIGIGITSVVGMLAIFLFYDVSMVQIMTTFALFLPPLFLSGIWLGFTCLQIIISYGRRGVEMGFVIAWFLLPFSGAYYPIEVLPAWAQTLSSCLPMSSVFQGMRAYLMHNQDPTSYLLKGYVLGTLYAAIAIMLFIYCFNRSKRRGFARLVE